MVSILVLPFSGLDGIELGFLQQQSCNQGKTVDVICGWTTLTSEHPLENDHKWQQICQIRYENSLVVRPVYQVCLFYTSYSCDRGWEPIRLLYFRKVWSTRFSFFVYFFANGAKKCGPPGFRLIQKTGWTTLFFSCLIWQICCHLWSFSSGCCDARVVHLHTIITSFVFLSFSTGLSRKAIKGKFYPNISSISSSK